MFDLTLKNISESPESERKIIYPLDGCLNIVFYEYLFVLHVFEHVVVDPYMASVCIKQI